MIYSPLPQPLSQDITACVQRQISRSESVKSSNKKPAKKKKTKNEEDEEEKSAKKKKTKPPAGKTRKIRLFPTQEQKATLLRWIGTARWTYNQCIASCAIGNQPADLTRMRALHVNSNAP
jgi:hypothetical protein